MLCSSRQSISGMGLIVDRITPIGPCKVGGRKGVTPFGVQLHYCLEFDFGSVSAEAVE